MKAYEKYKDSKVAWLGQIPKHWDILRAKSMFDKQKREVKENYDVVTCFRDGIVTLRKNRRTTGFTESLKEHGYQGVHKGDLVIHVMDAFAGAIGVSDSEGKATPVYSVCTAKGDYNHYYYAHIVRQMAKSGFIQSLYRGIRERSSDFKFEVFAEQYLPIPSVAEQEQIVRYLDWKVAMADKFISEKRREITLLKELRQAEINRAVTRGLDPTVPKKPSGIDWIGEIPKHWEVRNFNHHFIFGKGLPITKKDLIEEGIEVISYGQIHSKLNNTIGLNKELVRYVGPVYLETNPKSLLKKGDFVFADTSEDQEGSGNNIYIDTDNLIFAGYHTVIARPVNIDNCEYVAYLFQSECWKRQIKNAINGVKVFSITKAILRKTKILFPKPCEQQQIVEHIKTIEANINKAIEKIENEIALTTEYKTRLISDVTTGKIDVRGIVEEGLTISDNEEIDE